MGVTDKHGPTLRAIVTDGMKKYDSGISMSDLTVENIGKFIDDVNNENIK